MTFFFNSTRNFELMYDNRLKLNGLSNFNQHAQRQHQHFFSTINFFVSKKKNFRKVTENAF